MYYFFIIVKWDYKSILGSRNVKQSIAPLSKRVMAYIVDLLVCFFFIAMPFYTYYMSAANIPEMTDVDKLMDNQALFTPIYTGSFAVLGIFWMYLSLCEALMGCTLGKKLFNLHVVNTEYKKISVHQALWRNLTKSILLDFLIFDVFLMFFDKQHRRISDFVLKTLVIRLSDGIKPYGLTNIV